MKLIIDCGAILSLGFVKTIKTLINPLSTNPTKWSNTLKQFVDFCRLLWAVRWGACPPYFCNHLLLRNHLQLGNVSFNFALLKS